MGKNPFDTFEIEELPADLVHYRNAFDSRFIRFTVLNGKPRTCTITHVAWLKSSNKTESKRQLLIQLQEFEKPWAINVTNSDTIGALYGEDPHGWVGKRVTLYPTKTKFGRDVVDCIRVRDQIPEERTQPSNTSAPAAYRPTTTRAPVPQQQKRDRSQRERSYLDAMAKAENLEQLNAVEESITNDNDLTPEETQALARQLLRRQEQLKSPPPTA